MERNFCDKCGEEMAVYSYGDTVYGTDEDVTVFVCEQCKREIQEMQYGKEYQVYFRRINGETNYLLAI